MNLLHDSDLLAFFLTAGGLLVRAPGILHARADRIPQEYEIEQAPAESLTAKQQDFFAPYDQKLAAMNYYPVCTYRIKNFQRSLLRRYASPVDPAYCTVMALEVKYHYKNQEKWAPTSLTTFRTDLSDSRSLITRNMKRKTLLDRLPEHEVQRFSVAGSIWPGCADGGSVGSHRKLYAGWRRHRRAPKKKLRPLGVSSQLPWRAPLQWMVALSAALRHHCRGHRLLVTRALQQHRLMLEPNAAR